VEYGSVGASADDLFNQIVSGEEISGYEIGARRIPATRKRRLVSGVPSTSVNAASVADITTQPQELFMIERITVPSDIAFFFIFTDIKVGQRSQLVSAGQLPCGAFTEVAVDSYVHFDTASVGNLVTLSVQNIDASTRTFRAMLLGKSEL